MMTQTIPMTAQTPPNDLVEAARTLGKDLGFWRNGFGYRHAAGQLFGDTQLEGKTLLEIGCGRAIYCIWAKIHGAGHVVGLEPLADGACDSAKCYRDFASMVRALHLDNIELLPLRFQDYQPSPGHFDIAVSYASINHLDEPSCVDLRTSVAARESYLTIFRQLRSMMKDGGKLIVVDASRRNFFGDCGLKSPANPHIEWFKHQAPELWAELLLRVGFKTPQISWLSGNWFRRLGVYTTSKSASYFGGSMFRLEMSC
jgi:hypothetical protein